VVTLILGNTNGTGNRLLGDTSYGPDAIEVSLLEAYLQADFDAVKIKGGRQVFKLGTGILFEDAIDGLKLYGRLGPVVLTAAAFKAKELPKGTSSALETPLQEKGQEAMLIFTFSTLDLEIQSER
jgi:hypothetical protein